MKVKELIFYLNVLDQEKEVYIPSGDPDVEYYEVHTVKKKTLFEWETGKCAIDAIVIEFT